MRRGKWFAVIIGVALAGLLAGCAVEKSRFVAFKDGAAALSAETKNAYAGVVKVRDRMVALCIASDNDAKKLYRKPKYAIEASCSTALGSVWPSTEKDDVEDLLAYQSAAVDFLADYAKGLHTLATTDFVTGAEAGATKLSASVANFAATAAPSLDEQSRKNIAAGLGTVVRELAAVYVEKRRLKKLKMAMDQAQPHIEDLSALLQRDNKRVRVYAGAAHMLYVQLSRDLRPGATAKNDRIIYDEQVYNTQREFEASSGVLEQTNKAIGALPDMHKELRASLDDEAAPFAQLQAFVEEIQKAQEFYKKLNK